ncbi:MAG: response regulator [Gammaproteobacteria bacterium]|nr:response regulator [Gammaproteobacteria bacterium]
MNTVTPSTKQANANTVPITILNQKTPQKKILKKSLLIIEDDLITQNILKIILSSHFETDVACSAEEGWECFNKKHYDLVLTDIGLPGISGFELAKRIRKKSKDLPIIGITAHADKFASQKDFKEAGINELLMKPVLPDTLISILSFWSDKKLSG